MLIDGMKVFSATKANDRNELGDVVTRWLDGQRGKIDVTNVEVRQSSDSEFHCLSIIVFYAKKQG